MKQWIVLALTLAVAACGAEDPSPQTRTPTIVASNYPNYYFTDRLLEDVDGAPLVELPVIDGDPAFWVPDDEQLRQLQNADLVIINGASAEKWLDVVTIDTARIRSATAGISDRLITVENAVRHQHGPEGEHTHAGTAFTTWLDPVLATAQAAKIAEALIELQPAAADVINRNLEALGVELAELDTQLRTAFAGLGSRPILFSHPVYQYLARRYDLDGASVHFEPEEVPGTQAWVDLQSLLIEHPADIMLWEAEPLREVASRLATLDVQSVVFDVAANRPASNYIDVMRNNAQRLEEALAD